MPTTKKNNRKSTKRTTKSPAKRNAKRTVKASSTNSKSTSPYASAFNSAIKRGMPCSVAVNNIAQRTKKTSKVIFASLFKAGHVNRQKFNAQWIYWPSQQPKSNKANAKQVQIDCWQQFVDWCFANGFCTPEQMSNPSSQSEFMAFCRKFWNRQFNGATSTAKSSSKKTARKSSPKRKSSPAKAKKRNTTAKSKKRTVASKSKKRSTTAKSKKRSTSVKNKKRTAPKAKRSSTTRAKKSATKSRSASKPRTSVRRKSTSRSSQPASFKFPTATTRRIRKAA